MNDGAWHPDPTGRHQLRWWDGQEWTSKVHDDGITSDESATLSATSTCATCGSTLTPDDVFCGSCGAAAAGATAASAPTTPMATTSPTVPTTPVPTPPTEVTSGPVPPGPPPAPPPLVPTPPGPPVVTPTSTNGSTPPLPLILGGAAAVLTLIVVLVLVLLGRGDDDRAISTPETTAPPVTAPPLTQPSDDDTPVTELPITEPQPTEPPVTQPPVTEPPVTQPPVTEPPVTEPRPLPPTVLGFREVSGPIDDRTGSFLVLEVDLAPGDAMRFRVEPGPDLDTELLVLLDQPTAFRLLEVVWPVIAADARPDDINEFFQSILEDSRNDLNPGEAQTRFDGMVVVDGADSGWEGEFDAGFFVALTHGRYTVIAQAWSGGGDARLMLEVSPGMVDIARDLERYIEEPWRFAEHDPWLDDDTFFYDDTPYRP